MLFDISKTETFVPVLWILLKAITVVTFFGFLSIDLLRWNNANATTPAPSAAEVLFSHNTSFLSQKRKEEDVTRSKPPISQI